MHGLLLAATLGLGLYLLTQGLGWYVLKVSQLFQLLELRLY